MTDDGDKWIITDIGIITIDEARKMIGILPLKKKKRGEK